MKKLINYILLFSSIIAFISCDGPRLNPLDPFNPESRIGKVDGYVLTSTREPVTNAKVLWKNQNVLAITDSAGYYVIDDILRDDGIIYFEKEGLSKDSTYARWNNQKSIRIEEKLLNYTKGNLDGFVFAAPRTAIAGIKVIWKNQNLITETNSQGFYQFSNVDNIDGFLVFEKEGLKKDSVYVEWNGQSYIRASEKSLSYIIGSVEGFVFGVPREPLAGVRVIWRNTSLITETRSNGHYKFEDVPIKDGMIYFEKEGMKKDSIYVTWSNQNGIIAPEIILQYEITLLDGYVRTMSFPRIPISNVKVFWKNKSILTETNTSGYYSFSNIQQDNGWLFFERSGFGKDSVFVEFDNQKSKRVNDVYLNANPKLEELNIYTLVQNRLPDIQTIRLVVETSISDAEGDIDTVRIVNTSLNFSRILDYNLSTRFFEGRFSINDLNIFSMDDAIGKDFKIVVKDRTNRVHDVGSSNIKRIIKQEVTPEFPINRQVVGSQPTLRWFRFQPGYNFYYNIQIFTDEVPATSIWEKSFISSDIIEIIPDISIPPGDYYWLISVIDNFKNRGISKPYTFIVQ